jgi:hypothetical protein
MYKATGGIANKASKAMVEKGSSSPRRKRRRRRRADRTRRGMHGQCRQAGRQASSSSLFHRPPLSFLLCDEISSLSEISRISIQYQDDAPLASSSLWRLVAIVTSTVTPTGQQCYVVEECSVLASQRLIPSCSDIRLSTLHTWGAGGCPGCNN